MSMYQILYIDLEYIVHTIPHSYMYYVPCTMSNLGRLRLLKNTNNLPLSSVTLKQLMRLLNPLKRKHLLHKNLKRPIHKLRQRVLDKRIAQFPLVLQIPTAQRAPLNPHTLKQQRPNINTRRQLTATHKAQQHNPTVARRHSQISLEIRRADEVHG